MSCLSSPKIIEIRILEYDQSNAPLITELDERHKAKYSKPSYIPLEEKFIDF